MTVTVADDLKDAGFKFATLSSATINVFDMAVPKEKEQILHTSGELVNEIHNHWFRGWLSDDEKHRLIVTLWSDAKAEIEKLVKLSYKPGNHVYSFIDSGARGTRGQLTQMAGMK